MRRAPAFRRLARVAATGDPPTQLRTQHELSSSGEAVARAPDGRVVFIEGAAPDELVEVEVVQESKRFLRARIGAVLEASPERAEARCRHFGVCGGCFTQHVAHGAQVRSKQAALLETIRRIGKVDPASLAVDPAWSGEAYGYRTRARFAVAPGPVVGYRRRGEGPEHVVDVEQCPILAPSLAETLAELRSTAPRVRSVEEVEAIAPAGDGPGAIDVAPGVFAQSNAEGNRALLAYLGDLVAPYAPLARIVELYAGSGNLSRKLTCFTGNLEAFEGFEPATRLAPVPIQALSVERALERIAPPVPLLVANPPRTGLSEEAARRIGELRPERMIYVSCDPATFARDIARLSPSGLILGRVRLFDLYPQTPHAEAVGLFEAQV